MSHPPHCQQCNKAMEPGFTIDRSDAGFKPTQWTPGQPEKGFRAALRMFSVPKLTVLTYRCPRCGLLESYAPGG